MSSQISPADITAQKTEITESVPSSSSSSSAEELKISADEKRKKRKRDPEDEELNKNSRDEEQKPKLQPEEEEELNKNSRDEEEKGEQHPDEKEDLKEKLSITEIISYSKRWKGTIKTVGHIRLVFSGELLEDEYTLGCYYIYSKCSISKASRLYVGKTDPDSDEGTTIPRSTSMELLIPLKKPEPKVLFLE